MKTGALLWVFRLQLDEKQVTRPRRYVCSVLVCYQARCTEMELFIFRSVVGAGGEYSGRVVSCGIGTFRVSLGIRESVRVECFGNRRKLLLVSGQDCFRVGSSNSLIKYKAIAARRFFPN